MITFVCKNGDTAVLRVISCKESKMASAVNGSDVVNLDEVMNSINNDDEVKHINLALTYYDDEKEILDFINSHNNRNWNKYPSNKNNQNNNNQHCDCENCNEECDLNWKCPECGEETALRDKNGKLYPCFSCLQIDIGQRLEKKYMGQIKELIAKNNMIVDNFTKVIENNVPNVHEDEKLVQDVNGDFVYVEPAMTKKTTKKGKKNG